MSVIKVKQEKSPVKRKSVAIVEKNSTIYTRRMSTIQYTDKIVWTKSTDSMWKVKHRKRKHYKFNEPANQGKWVLEWKEMFTQISGDLLLCRRC